MLSWQKPSTSRPDPLLGEEISAEKSQRLFARIFFFLIDNSLQGY